MAVMYRASTGDCSTEYRVHKKIGLVDRSIDRFRFPVSSHHRVPDAEHDDACVRKNTVPVVASGQPAWPSEGATG